MEQDAARLEKAAATLAVVQQLSQANRRTDADKLQRSLSETPITSENARSGCLATTRGGGALGGCQARAARQVGGDARELQ